MLNVSIGRKTYILVSLIITVFVLIWGLIDLGKTREMLLNEKKYQLVVMVNRLDQYIDSNQHFVMAEFLSTKTDNEKRVALNSVLQPIINRLSLEYPGYGMGVHLKDLDIVASSPFSPSFLGRKSRTRHLSTALQDYNMTFALLETTATRPEKVYSITYPLLVNGAIIGFAWANYSIRDFETALWKLYTERFLIIFLLWVAILFAVKWAFSKIEFSLKAFSKEIHSGNYDQARIDELPELGPVVETVELLKQKLALEYEEKEKTREQIFHLDRLNLVSQMAAGVAHEIRNPMTTITGFLQLMHKKADEPFKEKIQLILCELTRINEIISDFLSLARNKVTEKRKLQLNDIIEQLQPLLYAEATKQGVVIRFVPDKELPLLDLDEKEIKQLILNLARNAFQAMGNHGTLKIETRLLKNSIRLSISDTGCGIPENLHNKVFDPFFTTKLEGTGLGLPICKSIVDRHNGYIKVRSQNGKGTTIIIHFLSGAESKNVAG